MNYRRLGRSGLRVSELSFGSWVTYGNQMNESVARECMAAAHDAGVNFFDNAEVYAKGAVGNDHGRCAAHARLAARIVHRIDEVLLGPVRRPEREEHAQPQIPDAGDRRLAVAARPRLRRHRVLPSRRSRDADRGDGARDERHDRRGQGDVLGHVGVERRRDRERVRDRRTPSPAQAGDRAAAIQSLSPRARRNRIRATLRRLSGSERRRGVRSHQAC